jgi:hypothetical protein
MPTARAQTPTPHPLLDLILQSRVVVELRALFQSMSHSEPTADTSIAWEDGEATEERRVEPEL